MPTYKGNAGNLMQHWTLCEILRIANGHATGLNYIDAHAMAPWATERTGTSDVFDSVRNSLPGQESTYERAWRRLAVGKREGYPSSAAFVRAIWQGDYALLLCETDTETADAIEHWLIDIGHAPGLKDAEIFDGEWQERFSSEMPQPSSVGAPSDVLTLVSFDPCIVSRRWANGSPNAPDTENVYLQDLEGALRALGQIRGGVLIQLSTYSASDDNPQGAVIASANELMVSFGFTLAAVVRVDGAMMSLVYERGLAWVAELSDLPSRFAEWLKGVK